MNDIGLVLEGGGMRGVYTAGVLEYFLDQDIHFPYVSGVSSGASVACSYLARQKGRNKKLQIGMAGDPRFLSIRNLWREKSLFGMNFLYDEVPKSLVPLDVDQINNSSQTFVIGTTDIKTGNPHYIYHQRDEDILTAVRASSSLPMLAPVVNYKGWQLLDGGVADPVPVEQAIADGCEQNIIVLTRPKGYRKEPFKLSRLARRFYKNYPGFVQALINRPAVYNETMDQLEDLEERGRVKVLRPDASLNAHRTEKDPARLEKMYNAGYQDAADLHHDFPEWLNHPYSSAT
ncbi:patatin-like phospholipase family protein [Salibacterium qingdaonense]|uniref:Predicted phospholipase, patatin/cPLA2 family n=1 Tax=Salibacterium qingdaonense TaxID=266892 RepID=A0A1I4NDQ1_9BACI|nr:patatin family protein [Salibacterium qingdaonense]SFM13692.1 Predicted phospholipase, patatin/cPLA2 family [Salibacterium qingdaonense]